MSEAVRPPESVYNLIPKEEVQTQKPPRYMSKFRPTVVLEKNSTKDAMRTMGPAKVEVPSPDKYLKKHSKEPKLPEKTQGSKDARRIWTAKKPAVPARTENPPMVIHTKRDFIKTTTVVPMKPQPTCVDTNKGHKQRLENSGLVPEYIKKKGLKKSWDELHHEYQGLSLVTDTLSKKAHKERLERAMKQLENDINLFERFKTIYIPNN